MIFKIPLFFFKVSESLEFSECEIFFLLETIFSDVFFVKTSQSFPFKHIILGFGLELFLLLLIIVETVETGFSLGPIIRKRSLSGSSDYMRYAGFSQENK